MLEVAKKPRPTQPQSLLIHRPPYLIPIGYWSQIRWIPQEEYANLLVAMALRCPPTVLRVTWRTFLAAPMVIRIHLQSPKHLTLHTRAPARDTLSCPSSKWGIRHQSSRSQSSPQTLWKDISNTRVSFGLCLNCHSSCMGISCFPAMSSPTRWAQWGLAGPQR
jgi:hypothetical protein